VVFPDMKGPTMAATRGAERDLGTTFLLSVPEGFRTAVSDASAQFYCLPSIWQQEGCPSSVRKGFTAEGTELTEKKHGEKRAGFKGS